MSFKVERMWNDKYETLDFRDARLLKLKSTVLYERTVTPFRYLAGCSDGNFLTLGNGSR